MQVNCLSQDELTYELQVRGIEYGTVDEMMHALPMAIRLEKSGDSVKYPRYPFTVDEDVEALDNKLKELEPQDASFRSNSSSLTFLKLQTQLSYAMSRIDNIPDTSSDRPQLWSRALNTMDQFHQNAKDAEKALTVPVQVSLMGSNQTQPNSAASTPPGHTSCPIRSNYPQASNAFKTVRPSKWNVTFSGDKRGLSLSAFWNALKNYGLRVKFVRRNS